MKNLNLSALIPKSLPLPFNLNLQPREKLAVMIAGAALAVFLIFQLAVFPSINRRDRLKAQIEANRLALQEIKALKSEYQALTRHSTSMGNRLEQRPRNFTLFSFIERLAGKNGIKNNIEYMKPSTSNLKNSAFTLSMVEMKISSLTMEQLTNFLYGVENSDATVWIKRISIQKEDNAVGLINTTLQVETIQR